MATGKLFSLLLCVYVCVFSINYGIWSRGEVQSAKWITFTLKYELFGRSKLIITDAKRKPLIYVEAAYRKSFEKWEGTHAFRRLSAFAVAPFFSSSSSFHLRLVYYNVISIACISFNIDYISPFGKALDGLIMSLHLQTCTYRNMVSVLYMYERIFGAVWMWQ